MTFTTANTTADAYVDKIATDLVATGVWSEPDGAFYPAAATPAKRVIYDGTVYVFIQRIVSNSNSSNVVNGTGTSRVNEIKVSFGSGYNTGTHALTGTTQDCGIPLESWQKSASGNLFFLNNDTGNGNKALQHFTWVDTTGSMHGVLIAAASSSTFDYQVFWSLERNTTKQYSDGFSNLYWVCFPAMNYMTNTSSSTSDMAYFSRCPNNSGLSVVSTRDIAGTLITSVDGQGNLNRPVYFHPFNSTPVYDDITYIGGQTTSGFNDSLMWLQWFSNQNTSMPSLGTKHPAFEHFFTAYRSPGDSKAYFQFPWYNNSADPRRRSLIAQNQDQWFIVGDATHGLVDGDVIEYTAPGPVLKKYLVKQLSGQESGIVGQLNIAMRYEP